MFSIFKNLFKSNSADLSLLIANGASIIDVRTASEFTSGHIKGSINIPLDQIGAQADKFKKNKQIIVCCRSGSRSGQAKQILDAKGFENITNGGSWQNVNQYK